MTRVTGYVKKDGATVRAGCWEDEPTAGWAVDALEVYGDDLDDVGIERCMTCERAVPWLGLRYVGTT
jgi:hypothetical protein